MSEAKAFKVGDLTTLKSGGPVMTVTALGVSPKDGHVVDVFCEWFSSPGSMHNRITFPPAALT